MIDPTINLGAVVAISVSALTGVGFVWAIKTSVAVLGTRLSAQDKVIADVQAELKTLNKVVTDLAVQNQRMNTIEDRAVAQGKRLDEALGRFNRWIDGKATI